jgi:hypothetical protein
MMIEKALRFWSNLYNFLLPEELSEEQSAVMVAVAVRGEDCNCF